MSMIGEEMGCAMRDVGAPRRAGFGEESNRESQDTPNAPTRAPSIGNPEAIEPYRHTGYELIALGNAGPSGKGKVPLSKGWRTGPPLEVDDAKARIAAGSNVGVRLRPIDLVLDVDPRNFAAGDDPLARLERELKVDFADFPTVHTGGGRHIYMLKPAGTPIVETLPAYKGLEFKTFGRQVVAAGSIHDNGRLYRWDDDALAVPLRLVREAPTGLLDLIGRQESATATEAGSRTPEDLERMLAGLDVLDYRDHDRWFRLMAACHHATAGAGKEEWVAWCIDDPEYADRSGEIGRRWDSLKPDKGAKAITERSLFKGLLDAGRGDLLPVTEIDDDFLDDPEDAERAEVADDWVWVADAKLFVRRGDCKKYAPDQWKSMYAPIWPEGDVLNAVWREKLPIKKFESLVYIPGRPEFPDGVTGGRYNIWRPSGLAPKQGDVTPFLEHMAYLVPDEVERGYVLDYMAHLVQRPEQKIHFALLMQGEQGTGKGWISHLMRKVIGDRNVILPNNDEVTSRWTAWMEGAQLAIIEELMASGRLEVANRLKPIITDPLIRIEDKGCKLYTIPNHLNLMCFTNHKDALTLEKGDRRWLVIFSPVKAKPDEYYEALFDFLEGPGPAAVSHWLRQRAIKLNVKSVAPATTGKTAMLKASTDEIESYIRDQIDECVAPFDFDLVRIEEVVASLPSDLRNRSACRGKVVDALKSIGAVKHDRYTKGDRPAYTLWSIRDHDRWSDLGAARRIDAYAERHV